jgi:dephospho-CoA kinase
MKIIGLTGGIGSGKTTVAAIFKSLGIPVFNADNEALALYTEDAELLREVADAFGTGVLNSDGTLNRMKLSAIVFQDEAALKRLNSLVHPRVANRFSHWKNLQRLPIVMRESAILFESDTNRDCDSVVVVTAPEKLRVQRVMKRSGMSETEVEARMARQWPESKLQTLADWVIVNDDNKLVLPQVMLVADALRLPIIEH